MVKRSRGNKLKDWEVALVKAMLNKGGRNDQDILAYFTRPSRSINHARISEIRLGKKHAGVRPANDVTLEKFLINWPMVDPETGLDIYGDELLIKAREAIIVAVQVYNNPKSYFRSELFIVTAIIAWTYLMHAYYKSKDVDYRYYENNGDGMKEVLKTKYGAEKHWDLQKCLTDERCPLDTGVKNNLNFLINIRHEIEHQMTRRIDDKISAKLQACCLNFNVFLKEHFGNEYGLERDLSLALQFSGIETEQKKALIGQDDLPAHIEAMRTRFEGALTEEEYQDPNYAYRVLFVPKVVNKKAQADQSIQFVKAGSEEAGKINKIVLKETEKNKYKPGNIVEKMRKEGYGKFSIHAHTKLWQHQDAKNPSKGYGTKMSDGQWYWYDRWLERVREYCRENSNIFII